MSVSIYWPMVSLIVWTACIGCLAVSNRIKEIRARCIPLQSIAKPRDIAALLDDTQATDNFNNLLQVPLLFYAWCLAAVQLQMIGWTVLLLAWAYVGLRIFHTVIQVTHNRVRQRFFVWVFSNLMLMLLWGMFAVRLMLNPS